MRSMGKPMLKIGRHGMFAGEVRNVTQVRGIHLGALALAVRDVAIGSAACLFLANQLSIFWHGKDIQTLRNRTDALRNEADALRNEADVLREEVKALREDAAMSCKK